MSTCIHGKDIDFYCAECDQENLQAKIDGNNAKVVIPKEDLEEFTWGQLFHFAKDSQSSNVYQQKRIHELESELTRVNALTETQARIIRRLVDDSVENTELKEANDAIDTLKDLVRSSYAEGYDVGFDNKFFGTDTEQMSLFWSCWKDSNSKKAIDRALKES